MPAATIASVAAGRLRRGDAVLELLLKREVCYLPFLFANEPRASNAFPS
jgi:hypothetical protein